LVECLAIMPKKNFSSLDSLRPIATIINEAHAALDDETFTINDSAMPEVLAGALGAGAGFAGSFVALSTLGITGLSAAGITSGLAAAGGGLSTAAAVGGIAVSPMVAGLAVLAAPAVVLAGVGMGVASAIKHKKLVQEKSRLYAKAIETLYAITATLKNEVDITKERADTLNAYNIALQMIARDLKADLGI